MVHRGCTYFDRISQLSCNQTKINPDKNVLPRQEDSGTFEYALLQPIRIPLLNPQSGPAQPRRHLSSVAVAVVAAAAAALPSVYCATFCRKRKNAILLLLLLLQFRCEISTQERCQPLPWPGRRPAPRRCPPGESTAPPTPSSRRSRAVLSAQWTFARNQVRHSLRSALADDMYFAWVKKLTKLKKPSCNARVGYSIALVSSRQPTKWHSLTSVICVVSGFYQDI